MTVVIAVALPPFRHELPEFDFRHKNASITKDKCASYIGKWYNISIPLPVVLLEESSHGRWRVDVIYPEKTALSSTIWWIYSSGFAMWRRHHSSCPGEEEMNHINTSERRKNKKPIRLCAFRSYPQPAHKPTGGSLVVSRKMP